MGEIDNESGKLEGQRNESSVLFSLDSLSAISDSSDEGEGAFGNSGDKSGLIDLNTLAAMGSESSSSYASSDEEFTGNAPVFNKVKSKKETVKMFVIIAVIALVVVAIGAATYFGIKKYNDDLDKAAEAQKQIEEKAQQAKDENSRMLAEAQRKIDQLEADAKKREMDDATKAKYEAEKAKVQAEMKELQAKEEAQKKTGSSGGSKVAVAAKSSNGSSGSNDAKPAAKKGSGPDEKAVKAALQASNAKATKCGKNGNLVVSMTLNGNGKASNIRATKGSFQGTSTEKCIISIISNSPFPTFSGSSINASWNYKL